ncbi:MAG: FtsX-like permease family protein [Luteitalea sp.]|nr:FtsX-like permease family protein [Luteitalea sp.]
MLFVFRMTVRELRASWHRLLFFFLCVAIGVGAIAALRSVIQNVRGAIAREARTLTAGDLVVQSNQPLRPALGDRMDRLLDEAAVGGRSESIETATMVRPAEEAKAIARMIELAGVDAAFPLYGTVALADGRRYTHALVADHGALVRPELLVQLGVEVGEQIVIGRGTFEIRGVLRSEPGRRLGGFTLGPRVLIDRADFLTIDLLGRGSRARYLTRLRVPDESLASLESALRDLLRPALASVRSYRGTEDRIGDRLETSENYLSLVGFVMVVLGGVGVWSVTRVFVRQKLKSIAVLKCLGAGSAQVLAVYVTQVALLAVIGSACGVGMAALAVPFVPRSVVPDLQSISFGLTWGAALQAGGVGVLVSLLFALVPLLEVRRVKPLLLLRDEAARLSLASQTARSADTRLTPAGVAKAWRARLAGVDVTQAAVAAVVVAGLVGLAAWQAGSLRVGAAVSLGFVGVTLALGAAGSLLVRVVQPLASSTWFPLRHAVLAVSRPGNQTRVILLAVGVGTFFILGVRLVEVNLLRELALELRSDAPDMFLIDVQEDQVPGVEAFVRRWRLDGEIQLLPVLRARVVGIRGRRIEAESPEEVRERGGPSREYTVTYRDRLASNERVVAGEFWPVQRGALPEVSIEENVREDGLELGDVVRFDVVGRVVAARVTSVREVDWSDARNGGFMFVFRPGALEGAPHWYLGVLRAPGDALARARFQRDLITAFPNVSAVDVREVLHTLRQIVSNITLAVSVVGGLALASGLLILIGAVAMTKFQRLYEAAILKTLGASGRTVAAMLAVEYVTLGALAGTVGALGACILSWFVTEQVFDLPWRFLPAHVLGTILLVACGVGAVGIVASINVLRGRPLGVLRAE